MPDSDLEIRGGPCHPDPEIMRGSSLQKSFFRPFGPQFGLKIEGGGGRARRAPPLDPPLECGREEKPDAKAVFRPFIVLKKQCHLPG